MKRISKPMLVALAAPLLLASCYVEYQYAREQKREEKRVESLYEWNDRGGAGEVRVEISLDRQMARFMRGDQQIGWAYVATGKRGHGTQPGDYKILEKQVDKNSTLYGWMVDAENNVVDYDATSSDRVPAGGRFVPAEMPYWMRLSWQGTGMHGGYIPDPGAPASHGCIRLPRPLAPLLYGVVKVGTEVIIRRDFADGEWPQG